MRRPGRIGTTVTVAATVAGVGFALHRHRRPEIVDEDAPGTAQWPPLVPLPIRAGLPVIDEPIDGAAVDPVAPRPVASPPPDARWVAPDAAGDCPGSHPIKVNERSGIYHVPGGLSYDRTNADRCYCDGTAATADGFRPAKR